MEATSLQKLRGGEFWGGKRESNPQPSEPQSGALPVELFPPLALIIATEVGAVRDWF